MQQPFNLGTSTFFNVYANCKDEDFNLLLLSMLRRYNYSKLIREKMKRFFLFFLIFMREKRFSEKEINIKKY